jgi:hypothetical protein
MVLNISHPYLILVVYHEISGSGSTRALFFSPQPRCGDLTALAATTPANRGPAPKSSTPELDNVDAMRN